MNLTIMRQIEDEFAILKDKEGVVCVTTQNYQDLITAFLTKKMAKNSTVVFVQTGFENDGSVEKVNEFFKQNDIKTETLDAKVYFKAFVGKKTVEEKLDYYNGAVTTILEKLSTEMNAKTIVAGNIFSPSFEDGLYQGLSKNAEKKISGTSIYTPLADSSLNHITQLFTRMKPSMGLPTYPFSRVGLVSQCIGLVTEEKMNVVRETDKAVEEILGGFVPGRYFFTAVADNIKVKPKDRSLLESIVYNSFRNLNTVFTDISESVDLVPSMTGWGRFLLINVKDDSGEQFMPNNSTLLTLQEKILSVSKQTRVGYCISSGNAEGKYLIVLRYFESTDFNVAIPSSQNWNRLLGVGRKIVETNKDIVGCYIDLSTKPPAKIGYL